MCVRADVTISTVISCDVLSVEVLLWFVTVSYGVMWHVHLARIMHVTRDTTTSLPRSAV